MLEKLNDIPAGIDGRKVTGRLSKEDYACARGSGDQKAAACVSAVEARA